MSSSTASQSNYLFLQTPTIIYADIFIHVNVVRSCDVGMTF